MDQSFDMRGRNDIIPFYDLVASITAEEFGYVGLVAETIIMLQNGGVPDNATPSDALLSIGHSTLAANSLGAS